MAERGRRREWAAVALAVASVATAAAARPAPPTDALRLQAVLAAHLKATPDATGEVMAVIAPRAGWAWEGAAGRTRPGGPPLTPAHVFRIASTTKPFVAAAVLRLMEDGRIDVDGPVAPLLSPGTSAQLRGGGYDAQAITVRQLLTHTSGLADHVYDAGYLDAVRRDPHRRWTRDEQVALAMKAKRVGAPGERFGYSDTGYVILGEIIERAVGRPLGPAVRALLDYDRLGLRHTWWEAQEPPPRPTPPFVAAFWGAQDMAGSDPSLDLYGGGGIVSSAGDLARFFRALVRGEVFRDPRTLALLMSVPDAQLGRGYEIHSHGLHLVQVGRHDCWGHAGFWGVIAAYCPTLDTAFAWTMNQADGKEPAYDRLLAALDGALPRATRP